MISRGTGKLKKYLTRWFQTSSRLPSLTVTRTVDAKNSIKKLLCSNLHEMLDRLLQINPTRENIVIKHNRYNVEQFYLLKTMAPPTDKMTTISQKNFRRGAKFSRPREVQIWNKVICQQCCFGMFNSLPFAENTCSEKRGHLWSTSRWDWSPGWTPPSAPSNPSKGCGCQILTVATSQPALV